MKKFLPWIILVLLAAIIMAGLILLRGNEDDWICNNGAWTKHGNPSAMMPTTSCLGATACTMEAKICSDGSSVGRQGPNCEFAPCPAASTALANPASVNCKEKGGTSVNKTMPSGGQYGLCYFDDNRACEEWAMFQGDCPVGGVKTTGYDTEAQSFCAWSGGSTFAVENAVCIFKDGSQCPDEAFYAGTCQKGQPIDSAGLQTYNNNQLGITFEYPKSFPVPVYQANAYGTGGYPAGKDIRWRLNLDNISKGACEGSDCYLLYFDDYLKMDSIKVFNELKNDSFIYNLAQSIDQNGNKVIKYGEAGISESRSAIIFGQNQTLILHDRTGNDPAFDKILPTVKFTK